MLTDFFDVANSAFREAALNAGVLDRFCTIGDLTVRLRFAGPALLRCMWSALSHLSCEPSASPALTVCLWDGVSTGVDLSFPWSIEDRSAFGTPLDPNANGDLVRAYFREESIHAVYQLEAHCFSMLDTQRDLGMFWIPDACQVRHTPLRSIIQWWTGKHLFQLVHGGAVGIPSGGVLFAGKSGSGKSNTALICVRSGLLYAGDDYVLLRSDPIPRVYSLYNSCGLDVADLRRFPEFAGPAAVSKDEDGKKAVLVLQAVFPEQVSKGFPIRAVVLPRVVANGTTKLLKASPAACFRALAPSTMFQLPGVGEMDMRRIAHFVRKVPGYVLEVGRDDDKVPELILGLLSGV